MKKTLLSLLLMFAACFYCMAQTVVFSDNFDSYTVGSHLAQSNSAWTTWSNTPGSAQDGIITNDQAFSAPNSLFLSGSNDQVYPFGNYTTGHYTVTFNMYIPNAGNGAYFNIQHVLLQQWAYECYFYNNGNGYLSVGGSEFNFAYPSNAWFPVVMDVDMDNDQTSLSINDTVVHTWPFHYTSSATTGGENQLAGINLYAGSPVNNAPGTYYVDDFTVTEVSAAAVGHFAVTPGTLSADLGPNESTALNLNFSNDGNAATGYQIITTYDIPNPDTTSTGLVNMQYCGDIATAIGFTEGAQYDMAIGFPASEMQQHIGKTLQEIHVVLDDTITNAKVRVYDMTNPLWEAGPGNIIYEQAFTPIDGWNNVYLDNPIVIDGRDLWIGVWIDQPAGVYPIYMDSLEANAYSAWYKTGSTWTCTFNGFPFNIAIGGFIDGTPINQWLSVNPEEGSIAADGSQTIAVSVNSNGMSDGETHTAKLHCFSSDFDNREVIVPVSLSVIEVAVSEHNQIEVSVYPNPATDFVQVTSDQIQRVEIHNMTGQKVFENNYCDTHIVIPTNHLAPGTYAVTVYSDNQKFTKQVIIK